MPSIFCLCFPHVSLLTASQLCRRQNLVVMVCRIRIGCFSVGVFVAGLRHHPKVSQLEVCSQWWCLLLLGRRIYGIFLVHLVFLMPLSILLNHLSAFDRLLLANAVGLSFIVFKCLSHFVHISFHLLPAVVHFQGWPLISVSIHSLWGPGFIWCLEINSPENGNFCIWNGIYLCLI